MTKPSRPSKNLVVTEGKDDVYVLHHLFNHYAIPKGVVEFREFEGLPKLLDALPVLPKQSELERLGVIVDADVNLDSRWQSLRDRLAKAGYQGIPVTPGSEGTIIQKEGLPTLGIWLMPDNQLPGMLEDFIGFLVPAGDPLWARASECLQHIPPGERRFSDVHLAKAQVHTWLAWQEEPGTPLGSAISKRYFDAEAAHAKKLMGWIRKLFNLALTLV